MPAILKKVSSPTHPMAIWGFENPVTAPEVEDAVKTLADSVTGAGYEFIIMTGTHGACDPPGLVDTQEIEFAEEDLENLKNIKTKDGQPISIRIWPINPINPTLHKATTPEEMTELTAFLNQCLRAIDEEVTERGMQAKTLVLLAYCCSAGQ